MDEKTDEELIDNYIDGDEGAFETLLARHIDDLYSYMYRLVGGTHEAEDLVQESSIKIWKNIKRYNASTSKFKTWMLSIARNSAIDQLRKKKNPVLSQFEDAEGVNPLLDRLEDESPLAHDLFAQQEDAEHLNDAIGQLPPQYREVLTLHYTNHLTLEEVATVLGEPKNTTKSRHRRALIALRARLVRMHPFNR
ncbi:MAG TPA: sigma-70 family RNA polymerase sigma factor [Candidatus Paceibacterota bacterium]|nr:sigma-70 family RNA polymerase sigma factor [Candidatus Paceibacterota bacterium]